jgi:hypothetical protein
MPYFDETRRTLLLSPRSHALHGLARGGQWALPWAWRIHGPPRLGGPSRHASPPSWYRSPRANQTTGLDRRQTIPGSQVQRKRTHPADPHPRLGKQEGAMHNKVIRRNRLPPPSLAAPGSLAARKPLVILAWYQPLKTYSGRGRRGNRGLSGGELTKSPPCQRCYHLADRVPDTFEKPVGALRSSCFHAGGQ